MILMSPIYETGIKSACPHLVPPALPLYRFLGWFSANTCDNILFLTLQLCHGHLAKSRIVLRGIIELSLKAIIDTCCPLEESIAACPPCWVETQEVQAQSRTVQHLKAPHTQGLKLLRSKCWGNISFLISRIYKGTPPSMCLIAPWIEEHLHTTSPTTLHRGRKKILNSCPLDLCYSLENQRARANARALVTYSRL